MRTREEQITELTEMLYEAGYRFQNKAKPEAERIILEAERRAEQRVRAEIGRDSERLDWLMRKISGCEARRVVGVISCTGDLDAWRNAIDAAWEVG